MKVAIFQNFLDTIGGAEVVGLRMARALDADIYTTNVDREKVAAMGFADVRIHSIGRVPVNAPFRQQLTLWRFGRLKLTGYDFYIINGDWAVSAAKRHAPNLWYVNATLREIWDMRDYVRTNLVAPWKRPIFDVWVAFNRFLNRKHVSWVERIVTNSTFTHDRVKNYLERDSTVIFPPIDTNAFRDEGLGSYWLSVNRLIGYKRVDMQIEAFRKMPGKKLVIIGPHEDAAHALEYVRHLRAIKPPNVEIREYAGSFDELVSWYASCRGFITTCRQEDFGMTAIEALSAGKYVIAPNEGGYSESILEGSTGALIDDIDADKLADAVCAAERALERDAKRYSEACRSRAAGFDVSVFISRLKGEMSRPRDRVRAAHD